MADSRRARDCSGPPGIAPYLTRRPALAVGGHAPARQPVESSAADQPDHAATQPEYGPQLERRLEQRGPEAPLNKLGEAVHGGHGGHALQNGLRVGPAVPVQQARPDPPAGPVDGDGGEGVGDPDQRNANRLVGPKSGGNRQGDDRLKAQGGREGYERGDPDAQGDAMGRVIGVQDPMKDKLAGLFPD